MGNQKRVYPWIMAVITVLLLANNFTKAYEIRRWEQTKSPGDILIAGMQSFTHFLEGEGVSYTPNPDDCTIVNPRPDAFEVDYAIVECHFVGDMYLFSIEATFSRTGDYLYGLENKTPVRDVPKVIQRLTQGKDCNNVRAK